MKWNKTAILLASLGIATAGAVAYLLTTENGRKFTGSLRKKGEEMLQDMDEISQLAKEKFRGMEGVLNSLCPDEKKQGCCCQRNH